MINRSCEVVINLLKEPDNGEREKVSQCLTDQDKRAIMI